MSRSIPAAIAALVLLLAPDAGRAQQGPRIDVLTGEPVRPRSEHPRPQPEIFNAPHAPRQEHRADETPLEIYIAPQIGGAQTDQYSGQYPGTATPGPYRSGPRRPYGAYQR